jgi:hypothetical protein
MEISMLNVRKGAAALALTAAVALTSVSSSFAMPMAAAPAVPQSSGVTEVQWHHGGPYWHRGGYYRGYRGYGGYRHGYRYHEGYWYPLAAFGAGALIGGALASEPRYVEPSNGINPRHYEWCANRYRSYRAFDNTFQPNNGPRQQCLSPFY